MRTGTARRFAIVATLVGLLTHCAAVERPRPLTSSDIARAVADMEPPLGRK